MSTSIRHSSPQRVQSGLGLIELMIAMLIGLLVSAAAIGIFQSNKRAFAATQGLGRIQESSQAAFEMMARDIREAGGSPCDAEMTAGNIITNASTATPTSSNWFVSSARPLHGFEGSGLTGQVATTDAIQVLRLDQDVRTLTTDMAAGATSVTYTPGAPQFAANDVIMVCDMRVLGIFRASAASSVSGANGTVSFGTSVNACSYFPQPNAGVCVAGTSYLFPRFSTVSRMQGVRWYVCDPDGVAANGYSLCRRVNDGAQEEVVPGVQDMQVQYLGNAGYVDASSLTTAADWNAIRAVRIALTMREAEATSAGSTTGQPLVRTVNHVVNLRNRTL